MVNNYEVLILPNSALGFYDWLRESNGKVPNKALQTDKGYYVRRALYSGSLIPCKIATNPPHMCAYMGYKEKVHNTKEYEVASSVKKHFHADLLCILWIETSNVTTLSAYSVIEFSRSLRIVVTGKLSENI